MSSLPHPEDADVGVIREFVDPSGLPWRVYAVSTDPTHATSRKYLPVSYQAGWLVFESPHQKFRLAPVPDEWEDADVRTLVGYLTVASHARPPRYAGTWPDERPAPDFGRDTGPGKAG